MVDKKIAHRVVNKDIKLIDGAGNPVKGKRIQVKQVNHDFLFGCGALTL